MITFYKPRHRRSRVAAFTLVEVMVSAGLGALVMAGVITMFLMIGRSSVRVANYSDMEKQTRIAFEQMGIDARMASNLTSLRSGSEIKGFTLTIPTTDLVNPPNQVTYYYDNSTFYRVPGSDHTVTTDRRNLVANVSSLTFERYDKLQAAIPSSTVSDSTVKHIQVMVSAKRSGIGVAAATQVIRSAAFTIRNKTS